MSPIVKGGWVGGLVVPVTLALVLPLAISVMSGQPSEGTTQYFILSAVSITDQYRH